MNWDAIGAIGEIIGSMAVILTIVYLSMQIRQTTKSARSASGNQTRQAAVDVLSVITGNIETARTYTNGLKNREELEVSERLQFDLIVFQMMRALETFFFEHQERLLSEEQWLGQWRGVQSILQSKGGRESWNSQKMYLARSCMEWVDSNLDIRAGATA